MLSPAPKAIEELGFFNDEGVWGQEEEERRGTGVGGLHSVPLLWSLCLQCMLQSRMWKAAEQGGESENNRHLMPLGAGQIMRCRAVPEPEPWWGGGVLAVQPASLCGIEGILKGQEASLQSLPSSSLDVGPSRVNSPGCPLPLGSPPRSTTVFCHTPFNGSIVAAAAALGVLSPFCPPPAPPGRSLVPWVESWAASSCVLCLWVLISGFLVSPSHIGQALQETLFPLLSFLGGCCE